MHSAASAISLAIAIALVSGEATKSSAPSTTSNVGPATIYRDVVANNEQNPGNPDALNYWAAIASIGGFALSVFSLFAGLWAAVAATNARTAAKNAENEIKRKLLLYSASSASQGIDQIDDAISHREYQHAAYLCRSLADYIDGIAGIPCSGQGATNDFVPNQAEWRLFATELREWRTKITLFARDGATKRFDQIEEWGKFTARIKPRLNAVASPLTST